jgi:hypothetical protein
VSGFPVYVVSQFARHVYLREVRKEKERGRVAEQDVRIGEKERER